MLTRILTSLTLVMYLVVGSVAVRFMMPEMTTVSFSTSYFSLLSNTELAATETAAIEAPEMHFAEIQIPAQKKEIVKPAVVIVKKAIVKKPAPQLVVEKVAHAELPFYEPVKLQPVVINQELKSNLIALYKDFSYEMIAEAKDEVSTKLAAVETEAEPEFFEYADEKVAVAPQPAPINEPAPTTENTQTVPEVVHSVDNVEAVDSVEAVDNKSEVVAIDDLLAFDYSKAQADLKEQKMPVVGTVTTQTIEVAEKKIIQPTVTPVAKKAKKVAAQKAVTTQEEASEKSALVSHKSYPVNMTIQIAATDMTKSFPEAGFEVRFQDDLSAAVQDYGAGYVTLNEEMAQPRMTRSVSILKRGYAPTNTDLILDSETTGVSVPMIQEEKFNELLAPYEARGAVGAVLVELDDNVEGATLDVPYSQVLRLDGDLLVTESDDFRYQLFMGVKAGNALLSYKDMKAEVTSKIIHIHERELTFDSNYFEDVLSEKVSLIEEDLLAKEKTALVISSESVKEFATNNTAKKLNNHTYKTNFNKTLLGARKYLELTHQAEPLFVGFKDQNNLEIPSENFMRYILSKFEDSNLGNRCLIQVNLNKEALKVDVAGESVGASLVTSTQILDADGKFYDSVGPKSRKVIVLGENQGAPDYAQDAKINFKITYQDGTVQYLGSYCSPNTYLVEQL